MAYYVPQSKKLVGHVPRVPHQIAPRATSAHSLPKKPRGAGHGRGKDFFKNRYF